MTRESFGHIRLTRKITIKKSMTFPEKVIDFFDLQYDPITLQCCLRTRFYNPVIARAG